MSNKESSYNDHHPYYRDSRLYREWTKALDDYGIRWFDNTLPADLAIRLTLVDQNLEILLLNTRQEFQDLSFGNDAFREFPRNGLLGYADGRFKFYVCETVQQSLLRWCDDCKLAFFVDANSTFCPYCEEDVASWAIEENRLSWFAYPGTVQFHPVDLHSYKLTNQPSTEVDSRAHAVEALKAFLQEKTKPAPPQNNLFDEAEAVAAGERERGQWERLKTSLSGPARVHGWPRVEAVEELTDMYPNFREACQYVLNEVRIAPYCRDGQMRIPNLLLVGGPSCGKSSFCRRLAQILAPGDWESIDLGQGPADFELVGSDSTFKHGKEGRVLRLLASSSGTPVRNPVLILDELDKARPDRQFSAVPALLSLLEKNDARRFRDAFFGVPVDASGIQFLATANDRYQVTGPLASRFEVFDVAEYTQEQFTDVVIPNIFREWTAQFHEGTFPETLSGETRRRIAEESDFVPRRVGPVLVSLANQQFGEFRPSPTFESISYGKETS